MSWEDAWAEVDPTAATATADPAHRAGADDDGEVDEALEASFRRCGEILNALMSKPEAGPFLDPVDGKQYPWYYEVIAQPQDLNAMKLKIEEGAYGDVEVIPQPSRPPASRA